MRRGMLFSLLLLLTLPAAGLAQLSDEELSRRVAAANSDDATAQMLLQGAAAARLLGDFDHAGDILDKAAAAIFQAEDVLINEGILQAMASGQGANGMQRAFRQARQRIRLTPIQIANFANNYPTLLTGGEFDDMILQMREDHPDPNYRCACYAQKAWVHRVAGRIEESIEFWARLADARAENPLLPVDNPQFQGQLARDLARAGRTEQARQVLEAAMSMEIADAQRPAVQRRWAQAFAELGDVEAAVEHLEPLLERPTLVTVNSLMTRYTWAPIRSHPVFQAMIERYQK